MSIWDQYDWVEDLVAEALRVGFEAVGQEYIVARMGWAGEDKEKKKGGGDSDKEEGEEEEEEEDQEEGEEEGEEEDNQKSKAS